MKDTQQASLAELRQRTERGDIRPGDPLVEDEQLPAEFWEQAELVSPRKTSVHLKLDPEVLGYFKRGGKGHLTRMQNVLAAYVRAREAGARDR